MGPVEKRMTKLNAATRPVALVTGGGTGVGAATALMLARNGYDVAVAYRNSAEGAARTADGCRQAGARAIELKGDVTRDGDCRAMADQLITHFGRMDALVNNAGSTLPVPRGDLEGLTGDHFVRLTEINVVGAFQMTRAAAPHLAQAMGSVVNVSSVTSMTGMGSSMAYAVSKGALNTLTVALARALAPVRVNAILPGAIDTSWIDRAAGAAADQVRQGLVNNSALGRISVPEDIAEGILWLLRAKAVTGELIRMDSGQTQGR